MSETMKPWAVALMVVSVAVWVVAVVLCLVLLESWLMTTGLVVLFSIAAFIFGMKIGYEKGEDAQRGVQYGFKKHEREEIKREAIKSVLECSECDGTGECSECDGSGECSECDGGGWRSESDGGEKCSECLGRGKCFDCNGRGRCPKCEGSGKKTMEELHEDYP